MYGWFDWNHLKAERFASNQIVSLERIIFAYLYHFISEFLWLCRVAALKSLPYIHLMLLFFNPQGLLAISLYFPISNYHNSSRSYWCFSFAPELISYSAPGDLHCRAAY